MSVFLGLSVKEWCEIGTLAGGLVSGYTRIVYRLGKQDLESEKNKKETQAARYREHQQLEWQSRTLEVLTAALEKARVLDPKTAETLPPPRRKLATLDDPWDDIVPSQKQEPSK